MAVPTFTGSYALKVTPVGAGVVYDVRFGNGVSGLGWSDDVTIFEVHTLPPGFTFAGENLSGSVEVLMDYYIAVRGGNADGFAEYEELRWSASFGAASFGMLFGLSTDWPQFLSYGQAAGGLLTIDRVTNDGNQIYVNDCGEDGTASNYDVNDRRRVVEITPNTSVFLRSDTPGAEVVITSAL